MAQQHLHNKIIDRKDGTILFGGFIRFDTICKCKEYRISSTDMAYGISDITLTSLSINVGNYIGCETYAPLQQIFVLLYTRSPNFYMVSTHFS
jgi:hypothetical protein